MFHKLVQFIVDIRNRIKMKKTTIDEYLYLEFKKIKTGVFRNEIQNFITTNEPSMITLDCPAKKHFKANVIGVDLGGSFLKLGLFKNNEMITLKKIALKPEYSIDVGQFIDRNVELFCDENNVSIIDVDLALSFSYPIRNITENDIEILLFTKNYQFFKHPCVTFAHKPLFVYNDSIATLISNSIPGMFNIVVICGTGVNCAYMKNDKMVNTEIGTHPYNGIMIEELLGGITLINNNLDFDHPHIQNRLQLKLCLLEEFIMAVISAVWDKMLPLNLILHGTMFRYANKMIKSIESKINGRITYNNNATVTYYKNLAL